jgi:AAA domain, putative AbiEii toxin, Type IV TA system/AAA ATPase domain
MTDSAGAAVTIASIQFRNFKAFKRFSVRLERMNILVGPNNAGKSTIIGALRVLAAGLSVASARRPILTNTFRSETHTYAYAIPQDSIPISLENVQTDYDLASECSVTFSLSNGNELIVLFTTEGECFLVPRTVRRLPAGPGEFRREFPITVGVVPVLGPVEHEEEILTEETVRRGLATHRASRHFRNYWRYYPGQFEIFREWLTRTWPGMDIERPLRLDPPARHLVMFCHEDRVPRELYWAGFGFQVWCQILTHVVRNTGSSLFAIDEPEIYLHPDLQRQLLAILREAGPDIVLATHSSEMVSEADPSDLLLIDKRRQSAARVGSAEGVQSALRSLGSIQNLTLTQLARSRRVLFVEGEDFKLLRAFARRLGLDKLAGGLGFATIPTGGFPVPDVLQQQAEGMRMALGEEVVLAGVFDRDYRCREDVAEILEQLRRFLQYAHIHARKEVENYLLAGNVLDRCVQKLIAERSRRSGAAASDPEPSMQLLLEITEPLRLEVQSQFLAFRLKHFQRAQPRLDPSSVTTEGIRIFEETWADPTSRMDVVPGKRVFGIFCGEVQRRYQVSLSKTRVVAEFRRDDVPYELVQVLRQLDRFGGTA